MREKFKLHYKRL